MPRDTRQIQWVFLDRDGTLNIKPARGEYIEHPDELTLLPGAASAVSVLNRAGLWTAVVTNQRGVALGRMSIEDLDAVHERLRHLLAVEGATLDAIYACTHDTGACRCRKPQPGLLLRAPGEQPHLDFARAAIVGDSLKDMLAGRRLGLLTVLLGDEHADRAAAGAADHVVPDLLHAAALLVASSTRLPATRG
jgi:D-glycero-D-manno-heptose 1,7-bisphosphate phosphatase